MKHILTFITLALAAGSGAMLVVPVAFVQQTTSAPGSPSATTNTDGTQLPPPPPFGGTLETTIRGDLL